MSPRLSWSLIDCNIMIRRYINSVLNIVAAVAVLTAFAPMLSWSRLEGVPVPNHFDIHGVVDGVGDRGILLVVALVGLGVYILTLLAQIFPNIVNLPVPARKAGIANDAKRDLAAQLGLLLSLLFSFCTNSTLSVAAGKTQTLNMWFIWGMIALVLVCIGAALFRIYRR